MVPYRYELIEYVPHMFTYIYEVQGFRPKPIVSFDALIYPLGGLGWIFTVSSMISSLLVLIIIQKLWAHASGDKPPNGWIFQGESHLPINWMSITN